MYHRTAGKVNGAILEEHAIRVPYHVAQGFVHDETPEQDQQAVGSELHPFGDGSRDQGRGDDGEHALEHGEQVRGDIRPVPDGPGIDASQQKVVGAPAENARYDRARAEGQCESDYRPLHAHDAHGREAVHHGAQHVPGAREPAVEHRQAGKHEQDQGATDEHPGGIPGVQHGRRSRRLFLREGHAGNAKRQRRGNT